MLVLALSSSFFFSLIIRHCTYSSSSSGRRMSRSSRPAVVVLMDSRSRKYKETDDAGIPYELDDSRSADQSQILGLPVHSATESIEMGRADFDPLSVAAILASRYSCNP